MERSDWSSSKSAQAVAVAVKTPTRPATPLGSDDYATMRRVVLLVSLATLLIVATWVGVLQTRAAFTEVAANLVTFTSGNIGIQINPTAPLFTSGSFNPGDTVTRTLAITNTGTGDLRYSIVSTATNADAKGLGVQMTIAIKSDVITCSSAGFSVTGTSIYTGSVAAVSDGVTENKLVGDKTAGSHTGDRTLAAGASETLCFQIALPLSTSNAFQGASTSITFTVNAEQTEANP